MADQKTLSRYKQFPLHTDRKYHSASLPLPNVVRIEVMSPAAKARYLGKFHSMMDGFRQKLTESLMPPDANEPFYAFFDPMDNGDIGFDVNSTWETTQGTINMATNMLKNLPVVGSAPVVGSVTGLLADAAQKGSNLMKMGTRMMGFNNDSTGACTMKEFSKSEFKFNKTIKCSWYMPEQEDMARVSLSRLIRMAYVRNFDMDSRNNFGNKLADALRMIPQQLATVNQTNGNDSTIADAGIGGMAYLGSAVMDNGFINKVISGAVRTGISLNEYFGGSLTVNPLPVRLTMGHQLDIEPLVINSIKVSGSQEQFMTSDGSNIPLFVKVDIGFDMWMIPDPNKGFVQYLGDDLFNVGYSVGKSKSQQVDEKRENDAKLAQFNSYMAAQHQGGPDPKAALEEYRASLRKGNNG